MNKHQNYYENNRVVIDQVLRENPELSDSKVGVKLSKFFPLSPDYLRKVVTEARKMNLKIDDLNFDEYEIELPESLYVEPQTYIFKSQRALIIGDIHLPFHNIEALRTALNYAKGQNIDTIILNGDILDMHSVSYFERDPNYRDVNIEIKVGREFLTALRKLFPSAQIIYKFGNHEYRYERYLMDKQEIFNLAEIQLQNLLRLNEFGITYIENKRLLKSGKLFIAHGDEFRGGSGMINVARQVRLKSNVNVIFGHFHKTQEDISSTLNDDIIGSWAVGCLSGLKPRWLPINMWNHGFAIVDFDNSGDFTVNNHKLVHGAVR